MKYLDKLINFIFSLAVLIVSAIIVLVTAGLVEEELIHNFISNNIFSEANNTLTCIIAIVTFFAALKTTVFLSMTNVKKKSTIMVDTNQGRIQIAQETIENTAKNVARSHEEVKDLQVRMVKEKRKVNVYMSLLVYPHTNIIELSSKIQDEVKDAIHSTTGVKVNNVDIKIKNIAEGRNVAKNKVKTIVEEKNEVNVPEEVNFITNEDIQSNQENVEVNNNIEDAQIENNEENKNE